MTTLNNIFNLANDTLVQILVYLNVPFTNAYIIIHTIFFLVVFAMVYKSKQIFFRPLTISIHTDYINRRKVRQAIDARDVYDYLDKVLQTDPHALDGIREIRLVKPHWSGKNVLGSYNPRTKLRKAHNGIVQIYALKYDTKKQLFFIKTTGYTIYLTKEEARDLQLFTLGHELGHCVLYRKGFPLSGIGIEEKCDDFSSRLNIVPNKAKTAGSIVYDKRTF